MDLKQYRPTVIISPVIDLLSAMHIVVNYDVKEEVVEEQKQELSQQILQWAEETRSKLSKQMREEMEVFFNKESFLGLTLIPSTIRRKTYDDIYTFLTMLREMETEDLFWSFINTGYSPDEEFEKLGNAKELVKFLDKVNLPVEEKWKISYLFLDGERTKLRFIQLIEQFYYQYFKEIETEAVQAQQKLENYINHCYDTNEYKGLVDFISQYEVEVTSTSQFIIVPSYFRDIGFMFMQIIKFDFTAFVLGVRFLETQNSRRGDKETIEAVRILTDERRFKVLQLLKKQPFYGYELAQALDVSNSTVSHHLSSLVAHKFVRSVRKENKVYYEVNKDEIQKVLQQFEQLLVD